MMERETDLTCYNVGFSGSQLTDHNDANYRPFSLNRLVDAIVSTNFTSQEATAQTCGGLYPAHLATLKSIDFSKVDFVTLLFGTNDWGASVPLKSVDDVATSDKQRTNVEDALIYSVNTLLTKYPHLRFVVITPYWRSASKGKDSDIDANNRGVYLGEFADYIQEVSENRFHFPCINLYKTSGANALTNRYYTSDGTHPTEMMKGIISKKILNNIQEIK
jgi:lysophospholipase L1-like esterase